MLPDGFFLRFFPAGQETTLKLFAWFIQCIRAVYLKRWMASESTAHLSPWVYAWWQRQKSVFSTLFSRLN